MADTLSSLVKLLDNDEYKSFEDFLRQKNKRRDVKNIALLKIIRTDDIASLNKLYPALENDRDAYHAGRKRLKDGLLRFLSMQALDQGDDDNFEARRHFVLGRYLLEHGSDVLAQQQLTKAAALAEEAEQFGLLNEVLLLQLRFAHRNSGLSIERLSQELTDNQERLAMEVRLHIAYAHIRQRIRQIQLKKGIIDLTELITGTMQRYRIDTRDFMSYRSLYQILCIADEYAAICQNYALIGSYILQSEDFLRSRNDAPGRQLFYHLHLLHFLANYHFRSRQYATSFFWLDKMDVILLEYPAYRPGFWLRQQMLRALNEYFSGNAATAIGLAKAALVRAGKTAVSQDIDDLNACLVLFYSQQQDETCLAHLATLTRSDAWYEKQMGMLWSIRKNIMEIVVQAQFDNTELALSRSESFKRRYKDFLRSSGEQRVLDFVKLLDQYIRKPGIVHRSGYQAAVAALSGSREGQDVFSLSFIAFLLSRWQKAGPYQVTLQLLAAE